MVTDGFPLQAAKTVKLSSESGIVLWRQSNTL